METDQSHGRNEISEQPKKRGRPRKEAFGLTEKEKAKNRIGRPSKRTDLSDETITVNIRIGATEKLAFQAEADRLGISLTDLMSIRIGATSGLTLAMIEIEKMRRAIDKTAQKFSVVQPQLNGIWIYIQDSDRAINKLSDDVRAGELATRLLSDRLADVGRARNEAAEVIDRLERIEESMYMPANEIANAVERLADMLFDIKSGS